MKLGNLKINSTLSPCGLPTRWLRCLCFVVVMATMQACSTTSGNAAAASKYQAASGATPFAITAKADSAYLRGEWATAARFYEELARTVPNDAFAWNRLGNIRLRQSNFPGAIAAYEKALERDGDSARTHYNLATAHLLVARGALENAHGLLPEKDGGIPLIEKKLGYFDAMVYESIVEVPSPNDGLIKQE